MNPAHYEWSVLPWSRLTAEPPVHRVRTVEIDGEVVELPEPLDPEWEARHRRHGAQVFDPRRQITYRATVDPETLELDFLSVEYAGAHMVAEQRGRQFGFPIERLASTVRAFVLEQQRAEDDAGGPVLLGILPGGLADGDGTMRKPPPSEEIARLMGELDYDRNAVAAHYDRPLRTVDRWITRARRELPDQMPKAKGDKTPAGGSAEMKKDRTEKYK